MSVCKISHSTVLTRVCVCVCVCACVRVHVCARVCVIEAGPSEEREVPNLHNKIFNVFRTFTMKHCSVSLIHVGNQTSVMYFYFER